MRWFGYQFVFGYQSNLLGMPQLDLFSYSTLILTFGFFFFLFIVFGYLFFFSLAGQVFLTRAYFSVVDLFQYVGGSAYLQGTVFLVLSREFTVYRFTAYVSQRM